jgi:Zn-finger nucleic acid-binding protein
LEKVKAKKNMKCPICPETDLVMTDRQGVEIDYCPKCRGIWLDRGELDKIIERAATLPADSHDHTASIPIHHNHDKMHERHHSSRDHHDHRYGRRKSWLQELFD